MRIRIGSLLALVPLLAGVLAIYRDREFIPQLACSIINLVGESSYCRKLIPATKTATERKLRTEEAIRLRAEAAQVEAESAERRKLEAERAVEAAERRKRDAEQKARAAEEASQRPVDLVPPSFLSSNRYYFVWDTRPPDDWLDLWEGPYARGSLIRHMPNGTALELLEKRPSKWYKFRIVETGEVGWTAWGNDSGNRIWIYCCRTLDALPLYPLPYRG